MKTVLRSAQADSDDLKKILVVMSDVAEVFKAQSVNPSHQVSVMAGMLALIANKSVPPADQESWLEVFVDAVRENINATRQMCDEHTSEAAAFMAQLRAIRSAQ